MRILVLFGLVLAATPATADTRMEFVSARANIAGGMLRPGSVYADANRIFLATTTATGSGALYVLGRDRALNFPVAYVLNFDAPIRAVAGDDKYLYVTSATGHLYVYDNIFPFPLRLETSILLSAAGTTSVSVVGDRIYVGIGYVSSAAAGNRVVLTATYAGDVVVEVVRDTWVTGLTYGTTYEGFDTVAFDRLTGARVGSIETWNDIYGNDLPATVHVDTEMLALTLPGCCGYGAFLHDPTTLAAEAFVPFVEPSSPSNTVVRRGPWLVEGTHPGRAQLYDIAMNPMAPRLSSLDLAALSGYTTPGDVNIRAVWADAFDNLVFAGSTWGLPGASPDLLRPALFVLELFDATTERVVWTNAVNVTVTGNSLRKNGGCDGCADAGAASQQQIGSGDGYVELTVASASPYLAIGLSTGNPGTSGAEIAYAWTLGGGYALVREYGVYRGGDTAIVPGDVLRVAVVGGVVKYFKNGVLLYTSTVAPTYPLLVDSSLWSWNADVRNVIVAGAGAKNVVWTSPVNVVAGGNSLAKSAGCDGCADAGAVSQQQIVSGDGYVEFTLLNVVADRAIGLSHGNPGVSGSEIDFAFNIDSGNVDVRESGVYRGGDTTVVAGDLLKIAVEGGVVKYSKNGVLLYTSTVVPTYPLLVDTSLWEWGSDIRNAKIFGAQ